MTKWWVWSCLFIFSLLSSCKVPLNKTAFDSQKKVGLLLDVRPMEHFANTTSNAWSGAFGSSLSMAAGSIAKHVHEEDYLEAFSIIEPQLKVKERAIDFYSKLITTKGKEFVLLEDKFDRVTEEKAFMEFTPPNGKSRKYYKKFIGHLKGRLNVDGVLIVRIYYGIFSTYKYGIETKRYGKAIIVSKLVNVNDNSIVYERTTTYHYTIANWDSDSLYEHWKSVINEAFKMTLLKEQENFRR